MTREMQPLEKALNSLKKYKENYTHLTIEACELLIEAVENEVKRTVLNTPLTMEMLFDEPIVYYLTHKYKPEGGTPMLHGFIEDLTLCELDYMLKNGDFYKYPPLYEWE